MNEVTRQKLWITAGISQVSVLLLLITVIISTSDKIDTVDLSFIITMIVVIVINIKFVTIQSIYDLKRAQKNG